MIHGAHVIIYSKDSEADRAFFRDVLKYESVDAGHGADLRAAASRGSRTCSPVDQQRWGSITRLTSPGGGKLGIYQPKHPSPPRATAT
jgi:hypothetical protein